MEPLGRVPPHVGAEQPPPPPMEPPTPGCGMGSLPTLPRLTAPLPPSSPGRDTNTRRASGSPTKAPLGGTSAHRCMSPPRGLVAAVAAAGVAGRAAQAPAKPWAEAGYETQVCIARARSALLRRPRSLGNWVQAFAHYDTTGYGVLGCVEFPAFMESLSLGLSRFEVTLITDCLTRASGSVSLGGFSEAITHGMPSEAAYDEGWAVQAATALAGAHPAGLRVLAGCNSADVLSVVPAPEDRSRLLTWLPKSIEGEVDWVVAEEWRAAVLADQSL